MLIVYILLKKTNANVILPIDEKTFVLRLDKISRVTINCRGHTWKETSPLTAIVRLGDSNNECTVAGEGFNLRREDVISANVTADTVYNIDSQHKTGQLDLVFNDDDAKFLENGLELLLTNQSEPSPIGNEVLLMWFGITLAIVIMCTILSVVTWCKCKTKTKTLRIVPDRGDDEVEEKTAKDSGLEMVQLRVQAERMISGQNGRSSWAIESPAQLQTTKTVDEAN